jgi:hypothetical protein
VEKTAAVSVCCVVIVFFIQWSGESKKEEAFYGCFQGFFLGGRVLEWRERMERVDSNNVGFLSFC